MICVIKTWQNFSSAGKRVLVDVIKKTLIYYSEANVARFNYAFVKFLNGYVSSAQNLFNANFS